MASTKLGEANHGNADFVASESLTGTEADEASYILKEKYSEENGKYSTTKILATEDDRSPQQRKRPSRNHSKKQMMKKVGSLRPTIISKSKTDKLRADKQKRLDSAKGV